MELTTEVNEDNPYLAGSYAPIEGEVTTSELEVIGEVPRDFAGVYARNGPNPKYAPRGRYHWFDGDGMIHAVHIEDGKVTYRNRFVQTRGLAKDTDAGKAIWSGLMEPFTQNPKGAPFKDTANTDLGFHNGELIALWYICGQAYRVDPVTLETRGITDFGAGRPVRVSAHTKYDERTGELMFFDYGPKPPFMSYGVVAKDGSIAHHAPIELPGPRLPHDMAITENYSILMDLPVFQKPSVEGKWSVDFHRDLPTRFAVIPRHGGETRWFEAEPCYIYHSVNAWEEDDAIVMIGCRTAEPLPPPDPKNGKWATMMANLQINATLHRWRFDLKTGACTEESLDDRSTEFPLIHNAYLGRKSRYSYHQALADTQTLRFDGIVKYDTETGNSQYWDYGDGCYGSESPFAPRLDAKSEDDGYVLSFIHNEKENRSELVILDAQRIEDGPLARVLMKTRVPLGFHARWVQGKELKSA